MAAGPDTDLHLAGCCCLACATAAAEENGAIDPGEPVEQNAGSISLPLGSFDDDGIDIREALLSGMQWDTTLLTFSFPDSISDYEYTRSGTFQAFNSDQQAVALYAFDLIEQYTNVQFTQLTGSQDGDADIRLAEESAAGTAYAYYPSDGAQGGDAWFNSTTFNTPAIGTYAFTTILHEIGHTMGLKHGHETSFAGALPYLYDSHEYSLMTYRSYVGSSGSSYSNAPDSGPQTYMMADIGALQLMYGANFNTQAGNTTYGFDTATGQMRIDGAGQLDGAGDTIFRTIWDGNGIDTYDFSNFSSSLAIDLRPGEGTDLDVGGLTWRADLGPNSTSTFNNGYARKHVYNALLYEGDARSLIENAKGGSGNDSFIGNAADNVLDGGAGDDRFTDSAGSDRYLGGAGFDEVGFGGLFASYSFTVGASFLEVVGAAVDIVADTVERLLFSDQSWDYSALVGMLGGTSPDAVADAFAVTESDAAGLAAIGSVLANDSEGGDLPLSVAEVNGQAAAVGSTVTLASGASVRVAADGTVSYGQNGRFAGLDAGETATDGFTYTVTNGSRTDTATVVITITGVADPNAAPVALADGFAAAEGEAVRGAVLANDSDADGDALVVTAVGGGAMSRTLGSGATVSMAADGTFVYAQNGAFDHLETGQTGTDSFTYTVSDGNGGSATALVTITIDGASPASPDAAGDAFSVAESDAAGLAGLGNVLANDTDSAGLPLSVAQVNGEAAAVGSVITLASGASLRVAADGSISYGQNGAFAGLDAGETATDSFTYTVSNGSRTDMANVVITIDGVPDPNAAPAAGDDAFAGGEGTAISGDVLANDSDPDGDALIVTGVDGGNPNAMLASGATVSMGADGRFVYSQNGAFDHLKAGETAEDVFTYAVSDGRGGTAAAVVTITVTGTAPVPDAVADTFSVGESDAAGLAAIGNLLANDTDADQTPLSVAAVNGQALAVGSVLALASGASLKVGADGSVSYGQNGAFAGLVAGETATESFAYTVTNGSRTDTATATITITGTGTPNTAPVARGDFYGATEGTLVEGDVLANDSDADGDALIVAGIEGGGLEATLSSGATVRMAADGTFGYWQNGAFDYLDAGEVATDRFTYTVADPDGATSTAVVTITIEGETPDLTPRPGDLVGTEGTDWLRGTRSSEAIFGLGGDDTLDAKHGTDILVGGAGDDTLRGDKHDPTVFYFGAEQQNGVVELDTIEGFRTGTDSISLGGGAVVSSVEGDRHTLLTLAGDGDQILLRWLDESEAINFVDDVPNRAMSPDGRSFLPSWGDLAGTSGGDTLIGTAAAERLFGLGSSDWLYGEGGADVLVGGSGNNKLFGGAGEDVFVFQHEARDGAVQRDSILDYAPGDAIRLVDTSVVSTEVQRSGIVLELAGDGDAIFVKHVYDIDHILFV